MKAFKYEDGSLSENVTEYTMLTLKNWRAIVEMWRHTEGGIKMQENVRYVQEILKRNKVLIYEHNLLPAHVLHIPQEVFALRSLYLRRDVKKNAGD